MVTNRQLLFNHIPKTGGITLRIILNRVYGERNIFLVKSTDIAGSLNKFRNLSGDERNRYSVVTGHGAELLMPLLNDPFRITLLREPVSLFISQYHYLKNTRDAGFFEEVARIKSIKEYLVFAVEKGQDNLLTRYLSGSVSFLADPAQSIPEMNIEGAVLLEQAKTSLQKYDAVIDLADFDAGIFYLSKLLGWKKIPLYRPANRNRKNPGPAGLSRNVTGILHEALRYDIALYEEFSKSNLSAGKKVNRSSLNFSLFQFRQAMAGLLS